MSASATIRLHAALVLFGLTLGAGLVYATWAVFLKPKAGTSFESINELRSTILASEEGQQNSEATTPLRNLISPHPSDQIIYDLRPNLSLTFQRANVRTNRCGMRGGDISIVKPANTFRIAVIGDSFTFGWGVEEHETFVAEMERTLNTHFASTKRVEVINMGVPGYSTFQEVARFEELGLDFNPDAVVVFFVENDFGPPFFIRDMNSSPGQILSLNRFMSLNHNKEREDQHIKDVAKIDPNKALRKLARITEARGIRTYLTINPKKRSISDKRKLWILKERPDIQFMDLHPQFEEYIARNSVDMKSLTLSFDPHPSPLKHKILGLLMAQYFF
jgi:hypothetical protein